MGFIVGVCNQKGGVGKTTSAVSISAELATQGKKVLLVDFDPQGSATSGVGAAPHPEGHDLFDMFFGKLSLEDVIFESKVPGLSIAPSSKDLVGLEIELGKVPGRELILRSEINLLAKRFDYVFIDCPPSSGLLTLNALGAARHCLIPLQAEYYALEGLSQLIQTIDFVKQTFNKELSILGVFLTMFDPRTRLASQVEDEARAYFKELMFQTKIPRNVRLSEAPSYGQPICIYDPESAGAKAYAALAAEMDLRLHGLNVIAGGGMAANQ